MLSENEHQGQINADLLHIFTTYQHTPHRRTNALKRREHVDRTAIVLGRIIFSKMRKEKHHTAIMNKISAREIELTSEKN